MKKEFMTDINKIKFEVYREVARMAYDGKLKEKADRITAAMIVRALEGDYHIEGLKEMPEDGMPEMEKTIQDLLTDKINEKLDQVLENLTLEDMRQYYLEYGKGCRDMYYI